MIVGLSVLNLTGGRVVGRAETLLVYFRLAILLVFCVGAPALVRRDEWSMD